MNNFSLDAESKFILETRKKRTFKNMKVKHIKMKTGERLPILLADNAVPDYWASLFVGNLLRSKAQNTIERSLRVVIHLRLWEEYHGRELSNEFWKGNFLSEGDIHSIADHCAYEVKAFVKWAARDKERGNPTRVASVTNVLALKVSAPLKTVTFGTQYNRLTIVASYLKFVAETVCRLRADKEIQTQINCMYDKILKKLPKANAGKSRGRYAHIPEAAYRRFMAIANPDHVDNPFREGEGRRRNHLMVRIAYELGLRAGEVLGLWVKDIEFGPKPTISVVRRHNNPLDPRKKQPVAKTLGRMLPISRELAAALNN